MKEVKWLIQKMKGWNPIKGDDSPYWTIALRDCPEGFHFENLTQDETCIHTNEIWDELIDYAERYYEDYEIVGNTFTDWLRGLQLSYDSYKLVFENVLKNLEYLRFDKGQTTTRNRTGNGTDSGTNTKSRNYSETNVTTDEGTTDNINVAFDSDNLDPTSKVKTSSENNVTGGGTETQSDSSSQTKTETESETVVVDRFAGENPLDYFERVLKAYPNIYEDFVKIFESNFTLREVLIW